MKQDASKGKNSKSRNPRVKREQPRKDSRGKRVNFDNERESKFLKDERAAAKMESCKSNDIAWYAQNPELLKSAASIGWSSTVGLPLEFTTTAAVPGIMSMTWSPVIGAEFNAPLNQAADEMYSFIVHANSRNTQYNAPDVMATVLAGSSVFAAFALGVRAYGTARLYSQLDYYTPDALLTAQGFSPSDIRANLSQMWFDLNEMAARLTQIWIPNTMPVLERWFWLCSNIYKDGDSRKAQYYLFTPAMFYQWGVVDNASGLTVQGWGNATSHTWAQYKSMINSMITALMDSEDRGIMMGDILKAYGPDKLFAVNPISADYKVEPVYDKEVLTQIENLSVFSSVPTTVQQDSMKRNLFQNWPRLTSLAGTVTPGSEQVLNFHQLEDPTPEQIMIATRLKVSGTYIGENTGAPSPSAVTSPNTFGTEVVNGVQIYYYVWENGAKTLGRADVTPYLAQSTVASLSNLQTYLWAAFDWAPWIYNYVAQDMPVTAYQAIEVPVQKAIGDYDNYIIITEADLRKMHRTAVYSEFGVPVL